MLLCCYVFVRIRCYVVFLYKLAQVCVCCDMRRCTVFPRNLAAPQIVAAFEISPRSSNARCTKRRPRILAACGKDYYSAHTYVILTLILNNAQCARSPIVLLVHVLYYRSVTSTLVTALEMSPRQTGPRN